MCWALRMQIAEKGEIVELCSWWWTAASWLHDGLEGRQSARWRAGSQKGSITGPRLPESSPISCRPGGFGHPVLKPRREARGSDTSRQTQITVSGNKRRQNFHWWFKHLHTVTEGSCSLHDVHNSNTVVTPCMWLLVSPPGVIRLLHELLPVMSHFLNY